MSLATDSVARLDAALARKGQDVIIRRPTNGAAAVVNVTCRAFVRGVSAEDLIAGIKQDNSTVIISPTQLIAAGFPGTNFGNVPDTQDRTVPTTNDKCIINGKVRSIDAVMPIYIDGTLVRIDMRVLG
jgi:hypothetical protein